MRFWLTLTLVVLAPPLWAADEPAKNDKKAETYRVPYKLTVPKHIMVRAKLNGKGPFNFILDTGAPALFLSVETAEKAGVKAEKGWGNLDRFEIEGGVVVPKSKARVEDLFQLKGMNGLGLGGIELHGVIGYNILAQYQMEIDLTQTKMVWTKLDWEPKAPEGLGGKGGQGGGLEMIGTIMQMLGGLKGGKTFPDTRTRGFLGIEVEEDKLGFTIKAVLDKSPAAEAGLKSGDRLEKINDKGVHGTDDLVEAVNKTLPGKKIKFKVLRGKESVEITVTAGEGF